jgi:3D (Asp-Asp-Asp) domain-containing protein
VAVIQTVATPIYIPAGNLAGTFAAKDIVIWIGVDGPTSTTIRVYNVTDNTHTTATLPAAMALSTSSASLLWDSVNNLLYFSAQDTNQQYAWVCDLGVNGLTFVPNRTVTTRASAAGSYSLLYMNHFVSKLKVAGFGANTYHFMGDADSVAMVSVPPSGRYYWSAFGRYTSGKPSQIATTTGSISVGSPVVFAVDSATGFAVGRRVLILDVTNGRVEATTLQAVSGLNLTAVVRNAFPTGSRVFIDGVNCVITSDSGQACFCYDVGGVNYDFQSSYARCAPLVDTATTSRASPDASGDVELWPVNMLEEVAGLQSKGNRGTLRNTFMLANALYPSPQPGTLVRNAVDGKDYLVIESEMTRLLSDTRLVALGPVN